MQGKYFAGGAEGEIRTRTSLRTLEPESSASTNSATPAGEIHIKVFSIGCEKKMTNIEIL